MGELFLNRKDFFLNCFFKWAKLAKFIRYEARWNMMRDTRCELKGASISITKFTEMGWNDGVLRALRNIGDVLASAQVFQFMYVEKNLFYYKEILH